ncbi:MAG: hypothetical protein HKN26_01510 [Acidimicrobiales bacterium]|nr:hypothetical protein [Acidimicrobiales bacterium]
MDSGPPPPTSIGPVPPDPGPIESAAPSLLARALAIVAIVLAGGAGGLIGYAVTDLNCGPDGCSNWAAFGAVVGAIMAAVGVAIVAVLTLRAMGEWKSLELQKQLQADREREADTYGKLLARDPDPSEPGNHP